VDRFSCGCLTRGSLVLGRSDCGSDHSAGKAIQVDSNGTGQRDTLRIDFGAQEYLQPIGCRLRIAKISVDLGGPPDRAERSKHASTPGLVDRAESQDITRPNAPTLIDMRSAPRQSSVKGNLQKSETLNPHSRRRAAVLCVEAAIQFWRIDCLWRGEPGSGVIKFHEIRP
jgi:hypothetical protein